jgi:branched-chain amino acid transport system substrate-binding protein
MEITSEMSAWRRSLAAVGVTLALASCTGGPASRQSGRPSEVRIGLLAPLSGSRASTGREALQGAQLAGELVNDAVTVPLPLGRDSGLPGLGGAPLKIVPADTGGDPERAATDAAHLVTTQGVAGLVNVGDTQATAAASERTERIGVPFVDAGAPAEFLTQRGMDWFFRTGPTDRMLGQQLLSMLQLTNGGAARKLAIVRSDDAPGTDMSSALKSLAGEGGYDVVADVSVTAANGPAAVDQLRGAAPDAVIAAAAQPADATALLNGFRSRGWHPPVTMAMGAGFAPQAVLGVIGGDPTGVLRSGSWSAELASRNPVVGQVAGLYKRRFGTSMTEPAAKAFTATLTMAQAIDAAGSTAAGDVRAALMGLNIPGRDTIMPWDGIEFDETGQNTEAGAVVEQLARGSARVVFPPELAARV